MGVEVVLNIGLGSYKSHGPVSDAMPASQSGLHDLGPAPTEGYQPVLNMRPLPRMNPPVHVDQGLTVARQIAQIEAGAGHRVRGWLRHGGWKPPVCVV